MKKQNYILELYKPSGEYLGPLLADGVKPNLLLTDISSLEFSVPAVIDGHANKRLEEIFDNYEIVLSYGDLENSPQQVRFSIYDTPKEFSSDYTHYSYSAYSIESKLERQMINSWGGILKDNSYFKAIPNDGYGIIAGSPSYIDVIVNASVSDLLLEIYEVRVKGNVETETPLIVAASGAEFDTGYYWRDPNNDGSSDLVRIALPEDYLDLLNTSNLDYYYFKIYDNPKDNDTTVVYTSLAGYTTEKYVAQSLVTESISGKEYETEQYLSTSGLYLEEILEDILSDTQFSYVVHEDIAKKVRSDISLDNTTIYQALKNIAENYEAVMITDTMTKTLYFYPDKVYGENKGLILKYGSYLKGITKNTDVTNLVTKIRGLGKDNLSITLVTPTQDGAWEDYSYYLDDYIITDKSQLTPFSTIDGIQYSDTSSYSSRWMSRSLAEKIGLWQFKRDFYHALFNGETEFRGLTTLTNYDPSGNIDLLGIYQTRKNLIENIAIQETKYDKIYAQQLKFEYLKNYYKGLDNRDINEEAQLSKYTSLYNSFLDKVTTQKAEIEALESLLRTYNNSISEINNSYLSKGLTVDEKNELKEFVKEYTLSDSSYESDYELLEAVIAYIEEYKYPEITIQADIIDILAAVNADEDKDKIVIGDKINIFFDDFNIDIEAQIQEISIDFDSNSVELTLANTKYYKKSAASFFTKALRRLSETNRNIVQYTKGKIASSYSAAEKTTEVLSSGLDANETKVSAGIQTTDNKDVVSVDSQGITTKAIVVDNYTQSISTTGAPDKEIKFVNGSIIIEDDDRKIEISVTQGISVTNKTTGIKSFYIDENGDAYFGGNFIDGSNAAQVLATILSDAESYADDLAENLQGQIDNAISTWFYSGVPSPYYGEGATDIGVQTLPYSNWYADNTVGQTDYYINHIGDLYYDIDTGKAYRFYYNTVDARYEWIVITDEGIQAALDAASEAQTTANSKMTIFYGESDAQIEDFRPEDGDLLIVTSTYSNGTYSKNDTYTWDTDTWVPSQSIENKTTGTVGGWNITTDSIYSGGSTPATDSDGFLTTPQIELGADGSITAQKFRIDGSTGDAEFKGTLKAETIIDLSDYDTVLEPTPVDMLNFNVDIVGGTRQIRYDSDGENPIPTTLTSTEFVASVKVGTQIWDGNITYDWSVSANSSMSGTGSASTFKPSISNTIGTSTTEITLVVELLDGSATVFKTITVVIPIGVTRDGADGAEGSSGEDAKTVYLTSDRYIVTRDDTGAIINASDITLNAAAINHIPTSYIFKLGGVELQNSASSVYILTSANFPAAGVTNTYTVETYDAEGLVATDTISIASVQNGSDGNNGLPGDPGEPGEDAITALLTNEAQVLSADNSGTVSDYSSAVTQIIIYQGATDDTANWSISATGTSGITYSLVTDTVTVTAMSVNSGYIDITATKDSNSITKRFSLSKSLKGETGEKGDTGEKGETGEQGEPGIPGDSGPGLIFKGLYENNITYYHTADRRDVVKYGNDYYAVNSTITPSSWSASQWTLLQNYGNIATNILLAADAYVDKTLNIGSADGAAQIALVGDDNYPYISIGQSNNQGYYEDGVFLGLGDNGFSNPIPKFSIKAGDGSYFAFDGKTIIFNGSVRSSGETATDEILVNYLISDQNSACQDDLVADNPGTDL